MLQAVLAQYLQELLLRVAVVAAGVQLAVAMHSVPVALQVQPAQTRATPAWTR